MCQYTILGFLFEGIFLGPDISRIVAWKLAQFVQGLRATTKIRCKFLLHYAKKFNSMKKCRN